MTFHSCYNTNPPSTEITPTVLDKYFEEQDYMEAMISEHNYCESYEKQQMQDFDLLDRTIFSELIKHEPKQPI